MEFFQSARQNHRLYGLDLDRLDSRHRDRLFATFAPTDSPVQPHPLLFRSLGQRFLEKKRESLKTSGRGSVGRERSGHHCRGWHPLFPPVCFWPNESFVREESAVNISPPKHEDS